MPMLYYSIMGTHEDTLYELLKEGQSTSLDTNDKSTSGDSDIYPEPTAEIVGDSEPEPDVHSGIATKEHRRVRGGVLTQAFKHEAKPDPQDRDVKVSGVVGISLRDKFKRLTGLC